MSSPVMAAITCRTNGELIANVSQLYPLGPVVLDPTYGRGKWWTRYQPEHLLIHDVEIDKVDFRNLPEGDCTVDAVAFDPPYLPQGGRSSSTEPDFLDRFGLVDAPTSPAKLRALIADGLGECFRVVKPGGLVLHKCMNYVSGGRHRPQVHWSITDALECGFWIETQFVHVSGTGPQPKNNRDGTARKVASPRANYSTLLVLRRPASARARRRPLPFEAA